MLEISTQYSFCSAGASCQLVNINKPSKKQSRIAQCRMCAKQFHSLCIGYDNKSENDFNKSTKIFSCDSCFALVDLVSEQIFVKVSKLFHDFKENIVTTTNNNHCNCGARLSQLHTSNAIDASVYEDKDILYTMKHDIEQLKSQFDAKPNAEYTLPDEDNKQMIINNNKASGNNTVSDSNASANCSQKRTKYFLCSIETTLSIEDIEFILQDSKVDTTDIKLSEPLGNFTRKRYIEVSSENRTKLFKFKLAFTNSPLNGTWFINNVPPKQRNTRFNFEWHPKQAMHTQRKPTSPSYLQTKHDRYGQTQRLLPNQHIKHYPNKMNSENTHYANKYTQNINTTDYIPKKNALLPTPTTSHLTHSYSNAVTNYKKNDRENASLIPFLEKALLIAKMN